MPRCLVSVPHLGAARTYILADSNLNALKEAICACPVLGGKVDLTSSSLQMLDKTFDEYVDLSPEDTIPDLSKILLRPQVDSEQHCASTSSEDSWKVALRYRFKNRRRVLPCDGRLGENRAKFGSRRKDTEETAMVELQRHKVQKMCTLYTSFFFQFCSDFARLTKIDPSPCIAKGINKIVKMAEMKRIPCEASVMASLEQAREMSPERLRTRHILTVAALRILSFNVKEVNGLSSLFVQEEDPSVPATPCIVYSGADVVEADLLHIKVDREKLFAVKNGEEGLAAVLSAYWLFNIQYDRKLFNTLVVLERLFLGLTLSSPRVVATKFLNKVTKSEPC
ncbi:uncharacterized protein [Dermacentor andersoni]|uniref:uncharacterized protein n=1 Tax=Dermacentor andersoni TaxID=34620 RepID=UPI003B3B2D9A